MLPPIQTRCRLLIISHVDHYEWNGQLMAYGPYVREIDIWADLFPDVVIASPLVRRQPPKDCLPFTRPNIRIAPQMRTGGDDLKSKAIQMLLLPILVVRLALTMRWYSAIHVRCPGNLGLLGALLAPMFSTRIVAKYAGQWNGYKQEPFTVRLQRWILASRWWRRGVVTVYGEWPDQPAQVVPFFTSMMTEEQVRSSGADAESKRVAHPVQILYAGRLVSAKSVGTLIEAASELKRQNLAFELHVVGDGEQRGALETQTRALDLDDCVRFHGAIPFSEVMQWYTRCHFLVLPSEHSEGWPKVLAEAMCHGVVCIGTNHGLLPWMLSGRGRVFPGGDAQQLAREILSVARDESLYRQLSLESARWARQYSLEKLRSSLTALLTARWGLRAQGGRQPKLASGD